MNQIVKLVLISILFISCTSKHGNMIVEGKINGLQKGTLYLEKAKDTVLVKVDSVRLDGTNTFTLSDDVASPQIYFISISGTNKILQFFGEKGKISITSNLKTFGYNPKITGSKNQEYLDIYRETNTKFNNLRLDLIKEKIELAQAGDSIKALETEKKITNIDQMLDWLSSEMDLMMPDIIKRNF